MSLTRIYAEPSFKPIRIAFLTDRLPVPSHMLESKTVPQKLQD
jgi:hypothetical protein